MTKWLLLAKNSLITVVMFVLMFGLVGYSNKTGHGTEGQTEGAIKRRLEMDTRVNPEHIGVSVENGRAKLFGTVETLEEKALATTIASSVMRVQSVSNSINVKSDVGKDRLIQNRIKQLLAVSEIAENNKITIRTSDGIVTLEGNVLQQQDKKMASRAAQSVKGVKDVNNLIQVVDSDRSDKEIYKDVILYLLWSPLVNIDDLKTEVKDGIVSLQGSVDHLAYKDVLMIDIENIHGVKEVKVGKVVPKPLKAFSTKSTENS